jgi:hypothetical protein
VSVQPLTQKLKRLNQVSLTTAGIGQRREHAASGVSLGPKERAEFADLLLQRIGH